jgi:nucleotide-binding universal stress UspA family protein
MFEKILYPTDFSDVSEKAIDYIKQLKEGGSIEVVILHVLNQRDLEKVRIYAAGKIDIEEYKRELIANTSRSLQNIERELKESGYKVKKLIKTGVPMREILKTEIEEDVSIIVIGSHGKSNLEEVFLGSVSEKVIRKCKKPVLVIKR